MNNYIDADSLLYRASHIVCCKDDALAEAEAIETDEEDCDIDLGVATANDDLEAMAKVFHSMVREIEEAVDADALAKGYEISNHIVVLTVKTSHDICNGMANNFRYDEMASVEDENVKGYKANRAGMPVPEGLNELYEYVFKLKGTVIKEGIEADDYVVRKGLDGHIVSALDKDVVYSVPYAYNYGKKEWADTTPEERRLWFWTQCITGDSSDGLRGVYRVGAKGAEKLLKDLDTMTDFEAWKLVVSTYYGKGQTLEEAIATARCVSMTQWTEENGLVLWTPPRRDGRITVPTHNPKGQPQWKYEDTGEEVV